MISAADLKALRGVSTCNVCDALELLGQPPGWGVVRGLMRVSGIEDAMVGIATTATFRGSGARPAHVANRALDDQLETLAAMPGPGVVVFQDLDEPWSAATGGEVRCRLYSRAGAVGLVTSGGIRDTTGLQTVGMAVYAAGITCSHGYHYVPDLDIRITVGGTSVDPGDIVHGDGNGIVAFRPSILASVIDVSIHIAKLEEELLAVLESGSVQEALAARREYKQRMEMLQKRIEVS